MSFPGLMTAMITPYDGSLQVNYSKAGEIAEYLCDNGSEGIVVSGTTGESPVLSSEEKLKLFAVVKDKIGQRAQVWAGTGSNNTAQVVQLSREAEKLGVSGVMLVCPYYNKPDQEGLYYHFRKVAESISIPVMLYNVPGRTGCNLLPETVARLAEIDNIVAIKEASRDMDQVSKLINLLNQDDMAVYSGDDSLTLPMMAIGAHGVISIASHIVGKEIKQMIEAFKEGDPRTAQNMHNKLFPIFKGLFIATNPVPLKEALNLMGMEVGGLRLPLYSANEKALAFLRELLLSYNKL